MIDKTVPEIAVSTELRDYTMLEEFLINYSVTDENGVVDAVATLDGEIVYSGQELDLFYLGFNNHTLIINATDIAGNASTFEYIIK